MEIKKEKSGIVGVAGEFFVAAELSQRGIVATLTLKNTPSIDILATNLRKGKTANIQVKTMSISNKAGWRLSVKDEERSNIKNHFYVLVDLQGLNKKPEYIIIPQKDLSSFINIAHRDWLSGVKRDGSPRKDSNIRVFDPNKKEECRKFAEKYKNNWEVLDLW